MDDLNSSDFSTYYILDATLGHIPHLDRGASLESSARFIPFDIVVIPGQGCLGAWISRVIIPEGYISNPLCVPLVLFSGYQDRSALSGASFETRRIPFSHFQRIEICSGMPPWESVSTFKVTFSVSAFRVIIITTFLVSAFRASSVFRSTFRVASSVSAFRVVITSQFDVQSHHHHFSVSAFRAIIDFQIDIQSHILNRHSESHPRFRRSESLSLLSLTFRVIIITTFLVSAFRASSVFRSTFRVPSSVSAFRVVITSQFDVQSHHHHFSVSAFRAIIGFQIDIQSRILGFGVQSRYHFSV
ncbi:hypothetical protein CK203_045679 [Vitis vinifera]|uniref:Uncharacterized protein n=1 Tax=Vitis vinifera TaxID=29760 RepID=A0A438HQ45_VITVI|nr:hypothetical protein CK203_045679 [Vitis vinifera]